ncbi:MAG: DUF5011 domain-containing protein [Clostridia bacterium]|jgi:hypothetical protein|nr:DUF5011 domain-containing protein [Clostridia bacterium]
MAKKLKAFADSKVMRFAFIAIMVSLTLILSTNSARAEGKEEEAKKELDELAASIELVGDEEYAIVEGQDFEDKGARLMTKKDVLLYSWRHEDGKIVVRDAEGEVSKIFTNLFANSDYGFKISEKVNSKKAGTYNPKYSFGDMSEDYIVYVIDKAMVKNFKASIELVETKERWVKRGEEFEDKGALLLDEDENILYSWKLEDNKVVIRNEEGEICEEFEGEFSITGKVDTSKVGRYALTYKFAGKTVVQIIHVVNDLEKADGEPKDCENAKQELELILALLGKKEMEVEFGTDYKEPGYRVADNTGKTYKSLEASVQVKGKVNTKSTGKNVIEYSIYENSLKRTVIVSKKSDSQETVEFEDDSESDGTVLPDEPDKPVTPPDEPDKPVNPPDEPDKPVNPPDEPDKPVNPPDEPDKPVNPPDEPDKPVNPPDEPDKPVNPPDEPDNPVLPPDPLPGGPVGPGDGEPGQVETPLPPDPLPGGPVGPGNGDSGQVQS